MAYSQTALQITEEKRRELQRRLRVPSTVERDHVRAQIILLRSEGLPHNEVAA